MQFDAFIRHAQSVKIATIAHIANLDTLIFTNLDRLYLLTRIYPVDVSSRKRANTALDVFWEGNTFSAGDYVGLQTLDVSATLDEQRKSLSVYVVNRSQTDALETTITLDCGYFAGEVQAYVVNGPDIKAENSFDNPNHVGVSRAALTAERRQLNYTFEPHSVTALVCPLE